jgi:hypothetical protein
MGVERKYLIESNRARLAMCDECVETTNWTGHGFPALYTSSNIFPILSNWPMNTLLHLGMKVGFWFFYEDEMRSSLDGIRSVRLEEGK